MLSQNPAYHKLSPDIKQRLDTFYRRFCQGSLGQHYGLGHLVYACHASFPLMLSPELANLIWINFKNYYFTHNNESAQVHPMAVTDFLLSPLCTEVGYERYEVHPEIRSYLLMLLNEGSWFSSRGIRKEGKSRLTELAYFLREYIQKKVPEGKYEGSAYRQLNNWAVMAWLKPAQLAAEIAKAFEASSKSKNEKAQIWLSSQMEKVNLQYEQRVTGTENRQDLNPFYKVFYYGRARNSELRKNHSETVFNNARAMYQFADFGVEEKEVQVSLPLMKSVVERAEREVNAVQRVLALFVVITENERYDPETEVSLDIIQKMTHSILNLEAYNVQYETVHLYNVAATASAISLTLQDLYRNAKTEDIVLFFFTGNSELAENNYLLCWPDESGENRETKFSEPEYNAIVQYAPRKCRSVIILNTNTGYYNWGTQNDVFIGATNFTYQIPGEQKDRKGSFLVSLSKLLKSPGQNYTYKDLHLLLRHGMKDFYNGQFDERPVMRMPKNLANNYFLSKNRHRVHYPLLAYNKTYACWQVIEEDFTILETSGECQVFDYEMESNIPGMIGELFLNLEQNIIKFEGQTEWLEQDKVYRVVYEQHPLYFEIMGPDGLEWMNTNNSISQLFEGFEFDRFSKWRILMPAKSNSISKNEFTQKLNADYPNGALLIDVKNTDKEYCEITLYHPTDLFLNSYDKDPIQFRVISAIAKKPADILPTIVRMVHYRYVMELKKTHYNNVGNDALNISFKWNNEDRMDVTGKFPTIVITDESYTISEGRIQFKPITVAINNYESFPVFYDIYFLSAHNGTIKKVLGSDISFVGPRQEKTIYIDEPELIDGVLTYSGCMIKVLTSRDPIMIDFTQNPERQL
jgi:hypothetical protein